MLTIFEFGIENAHLQGQVTLIVCFVWSIALAIACVVIVS